jgi:hypothetical protein
MLVSNFFSAGKKLAGNYNIGEANKKPNANTQHILIFCPCGRLKA